MAWNIELDGTLNPPYGWSMSVSGRKIGSGMHRTPTTGVVAGIRRGGGMPVWIRQPAGLQASLAPLCE